MPIALAAGLMLVAAAPQPEPAALLAANARPFSYSGGRLSGPGAMLIDEAVRARQFLLFGENHYLRETPLFAAALYQRLHDAHGFDMLVVEQDALAVADVLVPGVRSDAAAIGRLVARYPQSCESGSDEDILLLALAGRLKPGPKAICSAEKVLGQARYFEALQPPDWRRCAVPGSPNREAVPKA